MSEEIRTITDEEAMKALGEFATMCYNKGVRDVMLGVGVGAILSAAAIFGMEAIESWRDKKKMKKQINEFNTYVKEVVNEES